MYVETTFMISLNSDVNLVATFLHKIIQNLFIISNVDWLLGWLIPETNETTCSFLYFL